MTSVEATQGSRAARTETHSPLCRTLLIMALALAPALTPYLLTPSFGTLNKAEPGHGGSHVGHPVDAPSDDDNFRPHCLRCVLFASSLPTEVVLTPSAPLSGELPKLEVGFAPTPRLNPNVGARAPPGELHYS